MFFIIFHQILLNFTQGEETKTYGQCYYIKEKLPLITKFNFPKNRGTQSGECARRTLKYNLSIECEDFRGTSTKIYPETVDPNDKTSSILLGSVLLEGNNLVSILSFHNKSTSHTKRTLALQTHKLDSDGVAEGTTYFPVPEEVIEEEKYANSPMSFKSIDDTTFAVVGIKRMSPLINTYQRDYVYIFTLDDSNVENIVFNKAELPPPIAVDSRANNKGMGLCSFDSSNVVVLGYSIKQKSVFITQYERTDQTWGIKNTTFLENSSQNLNSEMKIVCQTTSDNKRFIYFRYFKDGLNVGSLGAIFKYKINADYTTMEISNTSLDIVNPGDIDKMVIDIERDMLYILGNFTANSSPRAFLQGYKLDTQNIEITKQLTREISYVFKTEIKNKVIETLKFTSINHDSLNNILVTYAGSFINPKKEAGEPFIAPQGVISMLASEGGAGVNINWMHSWESYQNYEQEGSKVLCSDNIYINKINSGSDDNENNYNDTFLLSRQKCDYKGAGMTLLMDIFKLSCPFGTFYKNGLCRPKSTKCSCFNTDISSDCLDSQLGFYSTEGIGQATSISETENAKTSDYTIIKTNAMQSATTSNQKGCLQFQLDPFVCLYQKSFLFDTTIDPIHLSSDGYGFSGFNELLVYLNQNKDQNKGENQSKIDTYTDFFNETIKFFSNDNGVMIKNEIIPIIPKFALFNNFENLILPLLETYIAQMEQIRNLVFVDIQLEFYNKSQYTPNANKLNKNFKDIFAALKTNRYFVMTAIDTTTEYLLSKSGTNYNKTADYLVLIKNLFTTSYFDIEGMNDVSSMKLASSTYDNPYLGDINGISDIPQRYLSTLESFTPVFDSLLKIWGDWICKTYYYISGKYSAYCSILYDKLKYLNSGRNLNLFYKEYKEKLLTALKPEFLEYYKSDSLISTILYKHINVNNKEESTGTKQSFEMKFNEDITLVENYYMPEVYSITIFPAINENILNNKDLNGDEKDVEYKKVTECSISIKTNDNFVKNFANSTTRNIDKKSFTLAKFDITEKLILYNIMNPEKASPNQICSTRVLIISDNYFWCIEKDAIFGGNFNVFPSINIDMNIDLSCSDDSKDIIEMENITYFIKFRESGRKDKEIGGCSWEAGEWTESKDLKTRSVVCKEGENVVDDNCCYEKEKPETVVKFKYIEKEVFIPEVTTTFQGAPIDSKFWKIFLTCFVVFYSLVVWYYATNIRSNFFRLKGAFNRIKNKFVNRVRSFF